MPYSRPTTSRTVDPTELELSTCRPIIGQEPLLILDGLFPRAVEGPSSTGPYTGMKLSLLSDPCVFAMRKQRPIGSLTEFCQMLFLPQQNMQRTSTASAICFFYLFTVLCLVLCLSWIYTSACGCPVTLRKPKVLNLKCGRASREVFCGFLP